MPTPPTTAPELGELIVRSRLLTADQVRAATAAMKPGGSPAVDLENFRKSLVASKRLTEYQLALLMRGHAEGFFLGRYRIMDLLAKGPLSGVYRANHESGRPVAIKVLPASKARDPEILARFQREARLIAQLEHPNIVKAIEFGEENGRHFLVLEFLEGDTLEEILATEKKLPVGEAVRIAHGVLLGLQHIHERGMIHRDINPANIMLVESPGKSVIKILDIGLGKAVFDEHKTSHVDDPSQLTSEGVLIGTSDYLAPEQARSARNADIRSDLYSVGCVLYHMLTGQAPFPDKSVLNQVIRHATEPPRLLSEFRDDLPEGLQDVLNGLLAKDPAKRYAIPQRAAQAVQLFLPAAPAPPAKKEEKPAAPQANIPTGKIESPGKRIESPGKRIESPGKRIDGSKPAEAIKPPVAAPAAMTIDVELIPITEPLVTSKTRNPEARGWFDFDRRDGVMAAIGGLLVIAAMLAGWALSKALRREPPPIDQPSPEINRPNES